MQIKVILPAFGICNIKDFLIKNQIFILEFILTNDVVARHLKGNGGHEIEPEPTARKKKDR